MKKKKIWIWFLIGGLATVAFLVGLVIFICHRNKSVFVYTETSGGFITPSKTYVYYVGPLPFIKKKVNSKLLDDEMADWRGACDDAYRTVVNVDPDAYYSKWKPGYDVVFPYHGMIYYHSMDGDKVFYEYNTKDRTITEIKTRNKVLVGVDGTMYRNIAALAILYNYPDIENYFKNKKGYIENVFYDNVGDRIFIVHGNRVYEYIPDQKRIRKVYNPKRLNVMGVYSVRW